LNVLALYTASEPASAALLTPGGATVRALRRGRTNEELAPAAHALLEEARLGAGALAGVAVARGPGSFTGLRVGAAAAMGIARGAGVRLFSAGTLEVWAAAAFDAARHQAGAAPVPLVRVVLDARRGELYTGSLRAGDGIPVVLEAPGALAAPDVLARVEPDALVAGDGRPLLVAAGLPAARPGFEQPPEPLALSLARLVARAPDRFACGPAGLVLDYVRRPQAVEALRGAGPGGPA
jgi:tRNA threonylcarbamoyladenosine biosynthesis protein TsaB